MQAIEWIIITLLVGLQGYVCYQTYIRIQNFKSLIPEEGNLYFKETYIPLKALSELSPKEIIQISFSYLPNDNETQATYLLYPFAKAPALTEASSRIVEGINVYLLRNKGAASDFNLIKDIVERNADALEEDINLLTPIPLYLGLMGTMLGIIIGLWNIDDLSSIFNEESIGNGINVLLNGVKIAMIASFAGLLMTVIISGWFFKEARSQVVQKKNQFYTMIQSELLPVLNKGVYSSLFDLQRGFSVFTNNFKEQNEILSKVIVGNTEVFREQWKTIEETIVQIGKMDIDKFAKANVEVLKQLQVTTGDLAKFNVYIQNLEGFVTQSKQIIERTDGLSAIANNLNNNFDASRQLFVFLSNHFTEFDKHRLLLEHSISQTDNQLSKTFEEFAEHLKDKMRKIEQISIQEELLMRKALSENSNNLSKLVFLEELITKVNELSKIVASQNKEYQNEIHRLNYNVTTIADLVRKEISREGVWAKVSNWFKN